MPRATEKLRALIDASGMSARRFAQDVLSRDERTVRRWLSGETEIPESAASWLLRVESVRESRGRILVKIAP